VAAAMFSTKDTNEVDNNSLNPTRIDLYHRRLALYATPEH
jgi:hypothetical protein